MQGEWVKPRQCRYIIGEPREIWAWCLKDKIDGFPYCAEHTKLCYPRGING